MTPAEIRRAAILCNAWADLVHVRTGLAKKHPDMRLNLGAYETHGDSGGCGHGASLVDVATGRKILDAAEKIIKAELVALGVKV